MKTIEAKLCPTARQVYLFMTVHGNPQVHRDIGRHSREAYKLEGTARICGDWVEGGGEINNTDGFCIDTQPGGDVWIYRAHFVITENSQGHS